MTKELWESDDLSGYVKDQRLLLGCLHRSRGNDVDSADPNLPYADGYCRSCLQVYRQENMSQVSSSWYLTSSTVHGVLTQSFPKLPIISNGFQKLAAF